MFPEKRAMTEEYDRAVHEQKMDGNSSDKPCRQALTGYFPARFAAEGFDRMTCPALTAVSLKLLQTSGSIFLPCIEKDRPVIVPVGPVFLLIPFCI